MSDTVRNKYCVIGASQSGKTYYVLQSLLPNISFDSVLLAGCDHNISQYTKTISELPNGKKKVLRYLGVDDETVLDHITTIADKLKKFNTLNPKKAKETLCIFDDFVNPKAIKDQRFISFLATCRHARITVIYVCHNVDVVLTPFMKTNMTHFIICQYTPSRNFNEFMHAFFDPLLVDELVNTSKRMPTEKEIRDLRDKYLHKAFGGMYGKLIIAKEKRRYNVIPYISCQPKTNDDDEEEYMYINKPSTQTASQVFDVTDEA